MPADPVRPASTTTRRAALAGLGAGGLCLARATAGRPVTAQDATPANMAEITLVPLGRGLPVTADGLALSLTRITFPVGGGDAPHTHPGTAIVTVESGTMGMTPLKGDATLMRGGIGDGEPIEHDVEITLAPGDAVFFAGEHGDVNRNLGESPLVFLVAALYPADQPPITLMATPTS